MLTVQRQGPEFNMGQDQVKIQRNDSIDLNPSSGEVETESSDVKGRLWLPSMLETSLGCRSGERETESQQKVTCCLPDTWAVRF